MPLPLKANDKLPKVITELNALGARVKALELSRDEHEGRLSALEEKMAQLTPCPDPSIPSPEPPPAPPDPPPAPPVDPEIHLIADPTTLAFTSTEGGASPAAKTVLLTKSGVGLLGNPQVVTANDSDGIVTGVGINVITSDAQWNAVVTPTHALAAGSYSATLTIRSPNQTNADIIITVTHVITAAAQVPLTLNLSTPVLNVSVDEGLDAQAASVTLTQSGDGNLVAPTASAPTASWISGVVITGSLLAWNAQLTFNTDALVPGVHTASVTFTSSNATNAPRVLTVSLLVVDVVDPPPPPPPPLELLLLSEPDELTFNGVFGQPTPVAKSLLLYRGGGGAGLNLPAVVSTSDPSGIIASSAIVVLDADEWTLTITPDGGLASGTYNASVTIRSTNQTNPDVIVPVVVIIAAAAPTIPLTLNLSAANTNIGIIAGNDASPVNVALTAAGTGVLDVPTAGAPSAAWISGVIITGAAPNWNAQLSFNTDLLAVGDHSATVDFSSTNGTNNPRTFTVNLTVSAAPVPVPTTTYKGAALPVGDQQIVWNSATRRFDNTVMITTGFAFGGAVHTPADAAALQVAMDASVAGDIIQLTPGTTYIGNFVWPAGKTNYVKIRSGTLAGLPVKGRRVFPADVANMAIIQAPNIGGTPAFEVAQGAKFAYFDGVCIRQNPAGTVDNFMVVNLASPSIVSEASRASRFIFDQCLVQGAINKNIRRTVRGDCNYLAFLDSYVGDTNDTNSDSQALWSQGGGHFKFVNTYFAGGGQSILFAGAGPNYAGEPNVHDVEIRRYEFTTPPAWVTNSAITHKTLFESKGVVRCLFEGGVLHRCFPDAQVGFCFLLTNYEDVGAGLSDENLDVVVFGMKIYDVANGINIANANTRLNTCGRFVFDHIVFDRLGIAPYSGGDKRQFQILRNAPFSIIKKITLHHITTHTPGAQLFMLTSHGGFTGEELESKNNVVTKGDFGFFQDGGLQGQAGLAASFQSYAFTKHALIGPVSAAFPPGNADGIVAADIFTAPGSRNYLVKAGSPYENWGDDGNDPGADIALVDTLTSGCITGIWP